MAASIAISPTAVLTADVPATSSGSFLSRLVARITVARATGTRREIARSPHLALYEAQDAHLLEFAGRD